MKRLFLWWAPLAMTGAHTAMALAAVVGAYEPTTWALVWGHAGAACWAIAAWFAWDIVLGIDDWIEEGERANPRNGRLEG